VQWNQRPYSPYGSLCPAVAQPFLAKNEPFLDVAVGYRGLTVAYGPQHLFSSHSLLVLAVTGPFLAKIAVLNTNLGII
jgi:hypothetical protein